MPEHVLVPYDGSPLAQRALEYACSEFESSTVTVLYVVDSHRDETASKGWGDHPNEWEDWLDDRRAHAEDLFADARSIADEYGTSIQTAVTVGRVGEMILRVADDYGADLLVAGTHGRSPLEAFVIGDVAEVLVRRSPIPVLTVREPDEN